MYSSRQSTKLILLKAGSGKFLAHLTVHLVSQKLERMIREIAILYLIPTNKKELTGREVKITENLKEIQSQLVEFIIVHVGYLNLVKYTPSKGNIYTFYEKR